MDIIRFLDDNASIISMFSSTTIDKLLDKTKDLSEQNEVIKFLMNNLDMTEEDIWAQATKLSKVLFDETSSEIKVPSNFSDFRKQAFSGSTAETIDLSATQITKVPSLTFENCRALKVVKLPSSIKKIEKDAFVDCAKTLVIEFPEESKGNSVSLPDSPEDIEFFKKAIRFI